MKHLALQEILAAKQRANQRARIEPRAERVSYDEQRGLIVLKLRLGAILELPVGSIRELRDAQPKQLQEVRAGFDGKTVTVDELDVDISIPGLVSALVGMESAATVLGRKGGAVKSQTKTKAVRKNGTQGGRPRKRQLA
ncbi:MAG: DUF2442 domain-containing protein [Candidatus Velthaea sp.]